MQKSLIDTSPFVALFDASDNYHKKIYSFLSKYKGNLITTWPVITETSYLLEDIGGARFDFLKQMESGAVQPLEIEFLDIAPLRKYMEKYADVPMDIADASLMYMADKYDIRNIISLDNDFNIYRTMDKKIIKNLISDLIPGRRRKDKK